MPDEFVYASQDALRMLDGLLAERGGAWWNGFFSDRAKSCPFLVPWPDENLVEWFAQGRLGVGRVLELGCGHGRNAVFLAEAGCTVDAVDFSAEAIGWATERAEAAGVAVSFQCCDIFEAQFDDGSYDLVVDSGCFHHLAPHRCQGYVELVGRALKPGGRFALVCFRPEGGSGFTDRQVYERWSLGGGLGYSSQRLRALWGAQPFSVEVLRQMRAGGERGPVFGADFLWALLATKAVMVPGSR
jgi:SAM-dependent methyltransferase